MKILLGISGSIGVLAIPAFVNQFLMQKEVEELRAIMTPTAARFLNPRSLEALLGSPVRVDPWSDNAPMISPPELVLGVDVYVIAPASTTTIARCAAGSAETLVANCYLACKAPVLFAPAMPVEVQEHPAVRANMDRLRDYGATILPFAAGFSTSSRKYQRVAMCPFPEMWQSVQARVGEARERTQPTS